MPPQDIPAQGKCQGQRNAETRYAACLPALESLASAEFCVLGQINQKIILGPYVICLLLPILSLIRMLWMYSPVRSVCIN